MYLNAKCNATCTPSDSNKTAFTMEFPTTNASGVYKEWLKKKENKMLLLKLVVAPQASVLWILLLKRHLRRTKVDLKEDAAGSSGSTASGTSRSPQNIEQGIPPADPQAGNASQPSTGGGVGRTDASGKTQAHPAAAAAASQSGTPTYTKETNNSAPTGAQGPGTSDSSAIATAWV
ncbi:mucin-like glycoprotein, putative, partial [Trypanosoma cruzi marinkellei]